MKYISFVIVLLLIAVVSKPCTEKKQQFKVILLSGSKDSLSIYGHMIDSIAYKFIIKEFGKNWHDSNNYGINLYYEIDSNFRLNYVFFTCFGISDLKVEILANAINNNLYYQNIIKQIAFLKKDRIKYSSKYLIIGIDKFLP